MDKNKCANRDMTEIHFDKSKFSLKKDLSKLKSEIEKIQKYIDANAFSKDESKDINKKLKKLKGEFTNKKFEYKVYFQNKFISLVEEGDYCLTATCIAKILDVTTDYVVRKLKVHIDYIHLPVEVVNINEIIDTCFPTNLARSYIYRDKELFFSKSSFIDFLIHNLYIVGEKSFYGVNIFEFISNIDSYIDEEVLGSLVATFINKFTKVYEYEDPIDNITANNIVNFKVDLVRSATVKNYLEDKYAYNKLSEFEHRLIDLYNPFDLIDEEKRQSQIQSFSNYFNIKKDFGYRSISDYKSIIYVQDVQVNRFISKLEHVKYHLKIEGNAKPLALFSINDEYVKNKSKYDGSRGFYMALSDKMIYLNLDTALVKTGIESELNQYLLKNYKKALKRKGELNEE